MNKNLIEKIKQNLNENIQEKMNTNRFFDSNNKSHLNDIINDYNLKHYYINTSNQKKKKLKNNIEKF